ncbi:MAG: putative Ig domain-containing protein [Thermodesulfobacteriota bacterium]
MKKNKGNLLLWAACLLGLSLPTTANASTFTVTNADDTGIDSLRWAIEQANQNPGPDQIVFDNSYTINPLTELPSLSDISGGTTIDGESNTVIIDGSGAILEYGLLITSSNNALMNLHVRSFKGEPFPTATSILGGKGIEIRGDNNIIYGCKIYLNERTGIWLGSVDPSYEPARHNKIQACYIGTSDGVTAGQGNGEPQKYGGIVFYKSDYSIIGTDGDGVNDEYEGNVISGNVGDYAGIIITIGDGNRIAGNLIGTDKTGTTPLPNSGYSSIIEDGGNNTIIGTNGDGVSDALEGNIISGNNDQSNAARVVALGRGARFSGNHVGVDITGTQAIANSSRSAVSFTYGGNIIGTDSDGVSDELERNIISANTGDGIGGPWSAISIDDVRIAGNYIGTDVSGTIGLGNGGGIRVPGSVNIIIGTNGDGINDAIETNIISANGTGIRIAGGSGGTRVSGNLIGTDKSGTKTLPNWTGVVLMNTTDNIIGTNGDGVGDAVEGNIIVASTHDYAVTFNGWYGTLAENNTVAGNYLGTDVTGTVVLGSGAIWMRQANNNIIGTNGDGISDELERNVISGGLHGVYLASGGDNNRISGNYIGLGADGLTPLGVKINGVSLSHAEGNIIGTDGDGVSDALEGNIILANGASGNGILLWTSSHNNRLAGNIIGTNRQGNLASGFGGSGINIYRGSWNLIGTDRDGVSDELEANIITNNGHAPYVWWYENDGIANRGHYNAISGNSIYNNVGQGIDLIDGANQGIATPAIDAAIYVTGGVEVSGTAVASSTVEIFTTEPLYGDGEGQTFVGKTIAAIDGNFSITVDSIYFDDIITATATDQAGNTSEFSKSTTTSGNQPPVLTTIGDKSVDEMETLIFTVTATDPENEFLTITAINLPESAVFDGAVFTWTPDYTQAGSYQLTFTASDSVGGSDAETINITVNAVNAPPAAAPTGGGTYRVLSDIILGGQVSDFDGEPLNYQWFDDEAQYCAGQITTIIGGEAVELPTCVIPEGLPVGSHFVTLEVSDGFNLPVTASVAIEVIDTNAPTLTPQANRNILWPPNHNMEEISIITNVWDESGCYSLDARVISNEPEDGLGDGDIGPDVTTPIVDAESDTITLSLRAERDGKGDGRVYSIEIIATDCADNVSSAIVEVSCPHDKKDN